MYNLRILTSVEILQKQISIETSPQPPHVLNPQAYSVKGKCDTSGNRKKSSILSFGIDMTRLMKPLNLAKISQTSLS